MGEAQKTFQVPRHHTSLKKPLWVVLTVSVISMLLISTHMFPQQGKRSSSDALSAWLPAHVRKHTDEEIAARVVVRDILKTPPSITENSKIAFLFLTPGTLPFEKLWDEFFKVTVTHINVFQNPNLVTFFSLKHSLFVACVVKGHEGKFSIYIHPSKERPVHVSRHFSDREIHSDEVTWGRISMVDAEKRLLVNALEDPDNQHFVLLSER